MIVYTILNISVYVRGENGPIVNVEINWLDFSIAIVG